ncbi:MAG: glycerophosphodiester phosphodiesterase [Thalassobius sp.]|nr:glycerophosphodiester phosphodiesterase [Thalassovita sp.]
MTDIKKLFIIIISIVGACQQVPTTDKKVDDFNAHPEHVLVAAHRSAHQNYPENSLASIKEAIRLGVDIIEIDVRKTSDDSLIIMHDRTVDRTTNGTGKVAELSFEDIRSLKLLHDEKPTEEQVLTLEEALLAAKGKVMVDIDFKLSEEADAIKTYELIKKLDMEHEVLFYLYDYKYIPQLHQLNPEIKLMPRAYSEEDVNAILKYDYIKIVHTDHKFYTDSLMTAMLDKGVRVWINALGTYDEMEEKSKNSGFDLLLQKHINVIQTDLPEELLTYLKGKDLHN